MAHALKYLFHPRSVAVVGAANNPLNMGYGYFSGLVEMGVLKKLYPVNLAGADKTCVDVACLAQAINIE